MNDSNPSCPACKARNSSLISPHTIFPGSDIFACKSCQHGFTAPEPDSEYLTAYYSSQYSMDRRAHLCDEYYAIMEKRANAQVDFIRSHADGFDFENAHCLDVGCGLGFLVAALQYAGAHAQGCDADRYIIWLGRLLGNRPLQVSDFPSDHGPFDLICLSHVLEHIPLLPNSLHNILRFLRPGGLLFFELPNANGDSERIRNDPEPHLHFFSHASLTTILRRVDLEIVALEIAGPAPATTSSGERTSIDSGRKRRPRFGDLRRLIAAARHTPCSTAATPYDGAYDRYSNAFEDGIWLRCLARTQASNGLKWSQS